jgi:hypothetical protein
MRWRKWRMRKYWKVRVMDSVGCKVWFGVVVVDGSIRVSWCCSTRWRNASRYEVTNEGWYFSKRNPSTVS